MKIASVSFHWRDDEIGGCQVPAVAFKQWCDMLHFMNGTLMKDKAGPSFECDLVGITKSGKPYKNYVTNHPDGKYLQIRVVKEKEWATVAQEYDFIFFGTPGPLKAKPEERAQHFKTFFEHLVKPFVIMVHGEYDLKKYYTREAVSQILDLPNCKSLAVMYTGHWGFTQKPELAFHPCTLPQYLPGSPSWPDWTLDPARRGVVFAARFSTVKNVELLANWTHDSTFMKAVGKVDAFGKSHIYQTQKRIDEEIKPAWNHQGDSFIVYDVLKWKSLLRCYRFFWDVFGSSRFVIAEPLKRLNLSAVEAIAQGCIPIVDVNAVPDWVKAVSVHVDIKNPDVKSVAAQIDFLNAHYEKFIPMMVDILKTSPYSFDALKSQVEAILGVA